MPKLTVNGIEVEVPPGSTVLHACEVAGAEIPRFCYHERLTIAGNCRMCLVEMEKSPKPVASCAMPAGDGMVIRTDTPQVQKARRGVMEFLLINHPLDCPICDQGGECDLQDQAVGYGYDRSRYIENKRAVPEKNFGPLVKTSMTRCIHCTRCVRFITEVSGVEELGVTGRGEHMEITTYVEKALSSELSGNIVDLCPVGALTSKPYAFAARPWELKKTETIDVLDAVGSNIRVDVRGNMVLRVLPRTHEDVNEEWLSDKSRHACDGLARQRLDKPYVRRGGKLAPASWSEAFQAIAQALTGLGGAQIAAIAGDLADAEAMVALKDLLGQFGSTNLDCRQDGAQLDAATRASYVFNTTIAGIERATSLLIIGSDVRWEAPIINARIRKRFLAGNFPVSVIGPQRDLTYRADFIGDSPTVLQQIVDGTHPLTLADSRHQFGERPMILIGQGALARPDGAAILSLAAVLAEKIGAARPDWNGFNVLHRAAARVGGLDLGFLPGPGGRDVAGILDGARDGAVKFVYLLGADEIDMAKLGDAFVVYQGHHGDAGASRANVILPGAAYTEKSGTYVNTEGRVQHTQQAAFPPGEAREDWKIIRALSEVLGRKLPYDSLAQIRRRLVEIAPSFAEIDGVQPAAWGQVGRAGAVDAAPFVYPIRNFYMTDPISRASETMAQCTDQFIHGRVPADDTARTGTNG